MTSPRVGIVGAGVIGLSTAVQVIETIRGLDVTVMSEEFSPNTTSDGAAGIWGPYLLGEDINAPQLWNWCQQTHDFFESLYRSPDSNLIGISQIFGHRINTEPEPPPFWKDIVYGYRTLDPRDLRQYGSEYCFGHGFTTYTAECGRLLPYLTKRFSDQGGRIVRRKVDNVKQLLNSEFDIVINCTGVRANQVTADSGVYPIRGQVTKVRAAWIKSFVLDDSPKGNYIIPNIDDVVLGGTHQEEDWSLAARDCDADDIFSGCCRLIPSLKNAEVIRHWVGLRPGRRTIRLEAELSKAGGLVIHNYGHGGAGITVGWGCAGAAAGLLREYLRSTSKLPSESKL